MSHVYTQFSAKMQYPKQCSSRHQSFTEFKIYLNGFRIECMQLQTKTTNLYVFLHLENTRCLSVSYTYIYYFDLNFVCKCSFSCLCFLSYQFCVCIIIVFIVFFMFTSSYSSFRLYKYAMLVFNVEWILHFLFQYHFLSLTNISSISEIYIFEYHIRFS